MIARENVIKGLQCIIEGTVRCESCGYAIDKHGHHSCQQNCASDAIVLLKEQEPILLENQHKPYGISTNANSPWISRCPRCGKKVEGKQTRFCKYCGQAVRWE